MSAGPAARSAASGPNRRATKSNTDSSSAPLWPRRRTNGSRRRRSLPRALRRFVLISAGGLAGKRAQLARDVDRAAARGGEGADDPRLEAGAGDERARPPRTPSSTACGPRSQRNPSTRALAMRPPGSAASSTSATSCPAPTSRCAAVSPEMPPPMIAMRTPLDPAALAGGGLRQSRPARAMNAGWRADGAGAGEVDDAGLLGALAVEDVNLLQRLDVLAGEGDRDDDDGARRRRRPARRAASRSWGRASACGPTRLWKQRRARAPSSIRRETASTVMRMSSR